MKDLKTPTSLNIEVNNKEIDLDSVKDNTQAPSYKIDVMQNKDNNLKTQIHKEFDEKFCTAFGKKVYVQRNGVEHQQEVVEYSADKIKSFIDQSIDKAIAEERERIVKEIIVELEKISNEPHVDDSWHRGEIEAYINILNNLNK